MAEEYSPDEDSEMAEENGDKPNKSVALDTSLIITAESGTKGSVSIDHDNFLDIDWPQINENGEEVLMRITVPILRVKKKREFKKMTRKRVVDIPQDDSYFSDEGDEDGEFRFKEDIIQHYETIVVLETVTKTVLIKTKNEDGEIEEIEYDVTEEFIISDDPSKFKVVAVKKVLSDGEEILEEHITPEMSVHEPYEAAESIGEHGEELLEEEASTLDELRIMAELEEEEEEDLDVSFAELEEEEESEEEVEESLKKISTDEEEEEDDELGEYLEEEGDKRISQEVQGKLIQTQGLEGEEEYEETEEEEEEVEDDEKRGEEEVLVARFPKDYSKIQDKEEEEDLKKQIESESTPESEEESVEEEIDQDIGEKSREEVKAKEGNKEIEKEPEAEELGEEEVDEDDFEGLEEEEYVQEEESEIEESDIYWWRTSGIDIDDFELPDDPIKANKILQGELWRQTKLRDKYTKQIERYFRDHKEEICYMPPYLEVEELQKYYKHELKELKQIIDTFSDSYDDFNYKMRFIRKRNKKSDKILYFFMDALKKTLQDLAKKIDKKSLTKIAKGQTLEQMITEIFRLEDNLAFAYIRKAIYTLEFEEMKLMVRGGDKDQTQIPINDKTVDLLLLAELQNKCHLSADLQDIQENKMKKLKGNFRSVVKDFCFKHHEVSYHNTVKSLNLKCLGKELKKYYEDRQREFKRVLGRLEAHKKNMALHTITKDKVREVREYIEMKNKLRNHHKK